VSPEELQQRIAELSEWHYRFEFDNGVSTPVPDSRLLIRQAQRRRYFFEPLLRLYGGSLRGRRVLDLGCSGGLWSLQAIEAGADFVLGVDSKQRFIEQGNLVFEAKGIDPVRYRFEHRDIFELDLAAQDPFDVVLCLSVINHTSRPVELFELMARTGAEVIVIETELIRSRGGVFGLSNSSDGRKGMEDRIVLVPSREAVVELAAGFGYRTVPLALNMTDYTGLNDYRTRRRLAFVCSKGRPLDALAAEGQALLPWWMAPLDPRRALKRHPGSGGAGVDPGR
jgi:tRNA (mo5U34)-methyltransferase